MVYDFGLRLKELREKKAPVPNVGGRKIRNNPLND